MIRTIRSFFNWLLGTSPPKEEKTPVAPPKVSPAPEASQDSRLQAQAYLTRVRKKISDLAEDFNSGTINRSQFQSLYSHYQRELRNIEGLVDVDPSSSQWKVAVTEGESVYIRRRHLARAQGYAIYMNKSGLPLSTLGKFDVDPALLVPMLSSYRSAAQEIFGAVMRSSQIEGGRWLCFVPGVYTTMLAVFSAEPAARQLKLLEDLHTLFERANQCLLASDRTDPSKLLFPHEYFLGHWQR
ncbi:MAG: hypothetical protein JXA42_12420 [Anaerolineales bacterium]|nr:hypothetical protein [Anaerolineales bacterium]